MSQNKISDADWGVITNLLPVGWESAAKAYKANHNMRGGRGFEAMMRVMYMHLGEGLSLRETSAKAKTLNILPISDVGILKRLRKTEGWFRWVCEHLVNNRPENRNGRQWRIVDATSVKELGKTGSEWRLHYCIDIPTMACSSFKLTSNKGVGTREKFTQFPVNAGDVFLGDRMYADRDGILHILKNGGDVVVRARQFMQLKNADDGTDFKLIAALQNGLGKPGDISEWPVSFTTQSGDKIVGRLCAIQKTDLAYQKSLWRLRKKETRGMHKTKDSSKILARYVLVFTTLQKEECSTEDILGMYRYRWQIELVFKRFKSLLAFGHIPKYDDRSVRAWLYGKLSLALLIQKFVSLARDFSPWGF